MIERVALALFVALIHGAWWLFGDTAVVAGNLADGDGYARLLRVTQLFETGEWFDSSLPRANAPYGGSLHWTRPFDVLLLALALPLAPILGCSKALFWSRVMVSPLLHVVSALALAWAVTPVLGRAAAMVAGALTVAQMGILGSATVGHADHHMAFALITIVALGFVVRVLAMPQFRRGDALAAGATLAYGHLGWARNARRPRPYPGGGRPRLAGRRARGGGAEFGHRPGPGPGPGTGGSGRARAAGLFRRRIRPRLDRHPDSVFAVVLAFWIGVGAATRLGIREWGLAGRLAGAVVGLGAIGAAMVALYPKILIGPLGDLDPEFLYLFDDIAEFASIGDLSRFLLYLGGAVFAVPWVIWRAWSQPDRWAWVLLAGALFVSVALAAIWVRASLYAGIFLAVTLADLIDHGASAIAKRVSGPGRSLCVVSAVLFLAVGPLTVGAGALYAGGSREVGKACPVQAMTRHLNRPPWAGRGLTILGSANFGPEILYRTNHKVLGTLHHRNSAGILDGVRILGGTDEAEVRRLVRERRVDLILLCPRFRADGYLVGRDGGPTLYRRLEDGEAPGWLREVALPEDLGQSFRLFEVVALH